MTDPYLRLLILNVIDYILLHFLQAIMHNIYEVAKKRNKNELKARQKSQLAAMLYYNCIKKYD